MYKKGTGDDKQGKDAGNRTLCPYRNFSQAIKVFTVFQIDDVSVCCTFDHVIIFVPILGSVLQGK